MSIRLYMDNDSLDSRVVKALRATGIDVLTTPDMGHQRLPDPEQLAFATAQGRVLYSANCGDFARLHRYWLRANRDHADIILRARQELSPGSQIRALSRICQEVAADDAVNTLLYVEGWLA